MYMSSIGVNVPGVDYTELFIVNVKSILDFLHRKDLLESFSQSQGESSQLFIQMGKDVESYKLRNLIETNKRD